MSPGITHHSLICGLLARAALTKCSLPLYRAVLESCCSLPTPPQTPRTPLLPQEVCPDLWEQLFFGGDLFVWLHKSQDSICFLIDLLPRFCVSAKLHLNTVYLRLVVTSYGLSLLCSCCLNSLKTRPKTIKQLYLSSTESQSKHFCACLFCFAVIYIAIKWLAVIHSKASIQLIVMAASSFNKSKDL